MRITLGPIPAPNRGSLDQDRPGPKLMASDVETDEGSMKYTMEVFSDEDLSGTRRQLGWVKGFSGYFSHIPPEKRKRPTALHCPVGGEITRDYWYCHNTAKGGDVKLCSEHQIERIGRRRGELAESAGDR